MNKSTSHSSLYYIHVTVVKINCSCNVELLSEELSHQDYVHVCTCMYMYVHVCTCMYMYVHVCTCMYMYVHVCTCMYMYVVDSMTGTGRSKIQIIQIGSEREAMS